MAMAMLRYNVGGRLTMLLALLALPTAWTVLTTLVRLVAFASLFDGIHSGIRMTQPAILNSHRATNISRTPVIPKIIHQVFHNWKNPGDETIPADWDEIRHTCIAKNPDWEYKLWTEKASRDFIATEYPTFLKTYDGYQLPVQRVDVVRYFLMLHYGGIYMDLDNGCAASLEPLRYYPVLITSGGQGALSNNILAARPHHPFWEQATQQLPSYDGNYILPYIRISYATGQWFVTDVWEKYHASLPDPADGAPENRLYQIMTDGRPGADPWVFFTQGRGGSWNNWDNSLFAWLGRLNESIPTMIGFVLAIVAARWALIRWRRTRRYRKGYSRISPHEMHEV